MSFKTATQLVVYSDGASRGNPGAASLGVVIMTPDGEQKEYGEVLGEKTNNQAEYEAILFGLKKAKQLVGKVRAKAVEVEMRMDSQLAVEQLSGRYKIQSENIFPLFIAIWNARIDFKEVTFVHVPREKNKEADRLANEALDREQKQLF